MLLGPGGCQIKNKILHQRTYSQMARRYNRQGKEGLVDRRHQHPGPKIFLSDERPVQLEMALQDEALD